MLAVYAGITSITWIKTLFFTPKDGVKIDFPLMRGPHNEIGTWVNPCTGQID